MTTFRFLPSFSPPSLGPRRGGCHSRVSQVMQTQQRRRGQAGSGVRMVPHQLRTGTMKLGHASLFSSLVTQATGFAPCGPLITSISGWGISGRGIQGWDRQMLGPAGAAPDGLKASCWTLSSPFSTSPGQRASGDQPLPHLPQGNPGPSMWKVGSWLRVALGTHRHQGWPHPGLFLPLRATSPPATPPSSLLPSLLLKEAHPGQSPSHCFFPQYTIT